MGIDGLLPERVLNKMSPADRKTLGKAGRTRDEAEAVFVARTEKELQAQIHKLLLRSGVRAIFVQNMSKRTTGTVGWPDFTFTYKGKPCALEVKLGNGKVRPEQIEMHLDMIADGWFVKVVRNYDEAVAFVKAMEGLT